MSAEDRRFSEPNIQEMEVALSATDAEQAHLPSWLRGMPLHSEPVLMYFSLEAELDNLPAGREEMLEVLGRARTANTKLTLLHDFHRGHRSLWKAGLNAEYAITGQAISMKCAMRRGFPPYRSNWDVNEYGPFLDELVEVYRDFYQERPY